MTILSARFIEMRDPFGRNTKDQYAAAYDDTGRVFVFHKDSTDHEWQNFRNQPGIIDPYSDTPTKLRDPVLHSLSPNIASMSDPDFTLEVRGEGFTTDSVIVWNNADETTTFVSDTLITTGVKPSTVWEPISIEVYVRTGDPKASFAETRKLYFTFIQ